MKDPAWPAGTPEAGPPPDPGLITAGWRLGLILWAGGMSGVVAITVAILPQLLDQGELAVPIWLVGLVNVAQSGAYLGLAVWAGVKLAPRVGLGAPLIAAAVGGGGLRAALRPSIAAGVIGGILGASVLQVAWLLEPDGLAAVTDDLQVPLPARILYGGLTEELLIRWGMMTFLLWLAWMVLQRRRGRPRAAAVWAAIVLSALPFGAGHLPLAAALTDGLTAGIAAWVVVANSVFGVLAGVLYWRFGLESAMFAHSLAHVLDHWADIFLPT